MSESDAPANGPLLVVSAHAGDFVWRAGGAVALASSRGVPVTVLCLSYGELGESARAWREGKQLEEIKAIRREEATQAAQVLGAPIEFLDAGAIGYDAPGEPVGAPPVLLFEPHQPEQCDFKPQVLLDITEVFDTKRKAMECLKAQQHMWDYYTDLARRRGVQFERNAGPNLGLLRSTMAEAFMRVYPETTRTLQ